MQVWFSVLPMSKPRHWIPILSAFLWLGLMGYGLHAMILYEGRPGSVGKTPEILPQNGLVNLPVDKPQLIVFAHPQCPCTRATLAELEQLVARAKKQFDA